MVSVQLFGEWKNIGHCVPPLRAGGVADPEIVPNSITLHQTVWLQCYGTEKNLSSCPLGVRAAVDPQNLLPLPDVFV